jgi:hypothetical protein
MPPAESGRVAAGIVGEEQISFRRVIVLIGRRFPMSGIESKVLFNSH